MHQRLLKRARRLAGRAEETAMTDEVTIDGTGSQGGVRKYQGKARLLFTGKTEVTTGATGASTIWHFAELHLPNGTVTVEPNDVITVRKSLEPALVNRRAFVAFGDPVTSLAGFQRITIRVGTMSAGAIA